RRAGRAARPGRRIGGGEVYPPASIGRSRQANQRYDILQDEGHFATRGFGAGGFPESGNRVRLADSLSVAGIYGAGKRDDAASDSGVVTSGGGFGLAAEAGGG